MTDANKKILWKYRGISNSSIYAVPGTEEREEKLSVKYDEDHLKKNGTKLAISEILSVMDDGQYFQFSQYSDGRDEAQWDYICGKSERKRLVCLELRLHTSQIEPEGYYLEVLKAFKASEHPEWSLEARYND